MRFNNLFFINNNNFNVILYEKDKKSLQTNQFCIIESSASSPSSVAHVTSHRTISRRRQFTADSVMRSTCGRVSY